MIGHIIHYRSAMIRRDQSALNRSPRNSTPLEYLTIEPVCAGGNGAATSATAITVRGD